MTTLTERWQPITELTEKMKGLAAEGEWEEIPAIELERRTLLEAFFRHPINEQDSPRITELVKSLLAEDQAIVAQGRLASQELLGKLNNFATGRKAQQAYADHS